MSTAQVGAALRHLRRLTADRGDEQQPDRQLLQRFAASGNQDAFAALLRRHGPMVLGVCRSVLHDLHDAEDAFQAAFLVLAQKAGSVRQESVGGYLYRVAYHLAVRARAATARRRARERHAAPPPPADPLLDLSLREVRALLYEELGRLPEQYRAPLVLCYLEERTLDEAARLLGWTRGAVKGRLERGRERLRARLVRRGLALSAGLLAAGLARNPALAAVPAPLARATLRAALSAAAGTVPARVATLIDGVNQTMFIRKVKLASLLFALACGAAGLGLLAHRAPTAPPMGAAQAEPPRPAPLAIQGKEAVRVRGRVLDPDGKPLAGAKVYLHYYSPKPLDYPVRAASGGDGRFAFTFARSELDTTQSDNPGSEVAAVARGYGFDVATVGEPGADGELTLRLVRDLPVVGRLLDQDGKPVAGARVRVTDVRAYKGKDLTAELDDVRKGGTGTLPAKWWAGPLPGQPASVTTGADGKFRLTSIGRERRVGLVVEGPAIQYVQLEAMTRAGEPVVNPSPYRQQRIYGATFEYLAAPSRPIRGVVRDQATGKPVAGVRIETTGTTHRTQTDEDGRYELLGYAKSQEYHLTAVPAAGQPYFMATPSFPDPPGFAPLAADIQLVRGIPVRGRVTDKETGKPIRRAQVAYFAVFPNPNTRDGVGDSYATTGPDGSYAVVALPGPGLLAVEAPDTYHYMLALVTVKEMKAFYKDWAPGDQDVAFLEKSLLVAAGARAARGLFQESYNALVLIEPDARADNLTRDVALRPALTLKGTVTGPDGKPLAGATVYGLVPHAFASSALPTADFTVSGLNPRRTRQLLFVHKEKGLGSYREIRGDEKGPLTVRLQPLGSASGRVLDRDGQPRAGLVLTVNRSLLMDNTVQVKTDKDGRFRATGLVPGQKYDLREANVQRPAGVPNVVVEPGKNKDLGDVTIDSGK
jgi:RNA polymerase sigma factor (sigma-70 family)